jgi:hypothetical protein
MIALLIIDPLKRGHKRKRKRSSSRVFLKQSAVFLEQSTKTKQNKTNVASWSASIKRVNDPI